MLEKESFLKPATPHKNIKSKLYKKPRLNTSFMSGNVCSPAPSELDMMIKDIASRNIQTSKTDSIRKSLQPRSVSETPQSHDTLTSLPSNKNNAKLQVKRNKEDHKAPKLSNSCSTPKQSSESKISKFWAQLNDNVITPIGQMIGNSLRGSHSPTPHGCTINKEKVQDKTVNAVSPIEGRCSFLSKRPCLMIKLTF